MNYYKRYDYEKSVGNQHLKFDHYCRAKFCILFLKETSVDQYWSKVCGVIFEIFK